MTLFQFSIYFGMLVLLNQKKGATIKLSPAGLLYKQRR